MRFRTWSVIVTSLIALGLVFVFYPANKVDAPRNDENRIQTESPKPIGLTDKSDRLVQINSIEFGTNLVRKLNADPSVGVIEHKTKVKSHYQEHEATVKFEEHPTNDEMKQIEEAIDGKVKKKLDHTYIFKSNSLSTPNLIDYFNGRNDVVFAEPNFIYLQNEIINDRLYEQYQWNLPAINTAEGWEFSRGNQNIVIAIIDTGVDMDHPDLVNRLTDGYNVLTDSPMPNDDNGHGTHVAGIIASETNNGLGIAGMTWYNTIMPVKAMNAEGYGTSFNVAKGIRWAVDHGADVINMSLGNYKSSKALKEAVDYANDQDVILVAAAGNENTSQTSYPAGFDGVLGVAAVGQNLNRASFSNYGPYIDVSAPGVDIASTYINGQYAALSGTSMAAPHVSALAGLIKSLNPDLHNQEVLAIIKNTTEDIGSPGRDDYTGNGVINIAAALRNATPSSTQDTDRTPDQNQNPFNKLMEWFNR